MKKNILYFTIFDFIINILSYKLELSNINYTIPQYLIVN